MNIHGNHNTVIINTPRNNTPLSVWMFVVAVMTLLVGAAQLAVQS